MLCPCYSSQSIISIPQFFPLLNREIYYFSIICIVLFTGEGEVIKDNPCAVGGTPSMLPDLLPPSSTNCPARLTSSILPVDTCSIALPFNRAPAEPPVLYLVAHI